MDDFFQKVYDSIKQQKMILPGEQIVLGVSGGPDSMCLLHVMLRLRTQMGLKLHVVHVHHGLRAEDADADQQLVLDYCASHDVPCSAVAADIKALAQEKGLTEEEAGRQFRYECFETIANQVGAHKIAAAHHKDDVAETFLMNLFRGTGLKGLCGIPKQRGLIIRPLLCVSRKEIEGYLTEHDVPSRLDATNLETVHTRNKIRLEMLPYVAREINPKVSEKITDAAAALLEAEQYIEAQACEIYSRLTEETFKAQAAEDNGQRPQSVSILTADLKAQAPVIQKRVLQEMIERLCGRLKDTYRVHLEALLSLCDKAVGKTVDLPEGLRAKKTYDRLVLYKGKETLQAKADCLQVTVPGTYRVEVQNRKMTLTLEKSSYNEKENQIIPKNIYTKWFDYDKIKCGLSIRTRKTGDFMVIDGNGHTKTIKRLFIDQKIPKEQRDTQLMLADDSHILWIFGERISEAYKVTEDTKQVLIAKLRGER